MRTNQWLISVLIGAGMDLFGKAIVGILTLVFYRSMGNDLNKFFKLFDSWNVWSIIIVILLLFFSLMGGFVACENIKKHRILNSIGAGVFSAFIGFIIFILALVHINIALIIKFSVYSAVSILFASIGGFIYTRRM